VTRVPHDAVSNIRCTFILGKDVETEAFKDSPTVRPTADHDPSQLNVEHAEENTEAEAFDEADSNEENAVEDATYEESPEVTGGESADGTSDSHDENEVVEYTAEEDAEQGDDEEVIPESDEEVNSDE
jgi:hypothetical protein